DERAAGVAPVPAAAPDRVVRIAVRRAVGRLLRGLPGAAGPRDRQADHLPSRLCPRTGWFAVHPVIGLVVVNVCFVVCGYGVLTAARRPCSPADAGLAFCAGLGALSLLACLVGLAGHVPGVAF